MVRLLSYHSSLRISLARAIPEDDSTAEDTGNSLGFEALLGHTSENDIENHCYTPKRCM